MSNVRVSNGSPTLERMDATRLSDQTPKPSACRSLFGPVDHEELKRELTGHLKAMEEAAAETWGFNFSTHTPRPNARFIWKLVDSEDLPRFYSASEQSKGVCVCGNNDVDLNGNCGLTTSSEEKEDRSEKQADRTDRRKRPACVDSSCPSKRSRTCLDETPHTPKKCSPPRHT
ncbi:cyclin-dependent kinase inhibitor 1Bb [Tachysurus fulvidraco]|uniref:cyclin-dependent kinase inhibitor 1Bb n=1 Tax=Tachysurus fulvidraco TaxID=1234273 RepID=UPI000F504B78|nr:cyclin-dependent kinase inhibitor 1Bb [Tachysurus fulvidraco]